jgi:carbon monoxide dehydrogenase subunit G
VKLEKKFDVEKPRAAAAKVVAEDDTLHRLFPDAKVEIVKTHGNERTVATHYTLLGQPGTATFTFTVESGGDIHFEKHCDGKVWKELKGSVKLTARGDGTRVKIGTVGHTKAFVPEFAIRGPMQEQIDQMAEALRDLIQARA